MTDEEILAQIKNRFPDAVVNVPEAKDFTIVLRPDSLMDVATYLRDEAGMDFLSSVASVDYEDRFEVVYHLGAVARKGGHLVLKVGLPKDDPSVPSLTPLWPGVEFQECEVYDLMGIRFVGHPDLRRIMMWEGYEGHPLRKDFVPSYPLQTGELVGRPYAESKDF